jgi:hypothetical protein
MKNVPFLKFTIGIIIFITPIVTAFSQQDLSAKEIVKKADDNMRGKTSEADITIKIIRPNWSREKNTKAWSKGDDYAMILVTSPAREKGTVFLKRITLAQKFIPYLMA